MDRTEVVLRLMANAEAAQKAWISARLKRDAASDEQERAVDLTASLTVEMDRAAANLKEADGRLAHALAGDDGHL